VLIWKENRGRENSMIQAHIEMNLNEHISVISSRVIDLIKSNDEMILETLMRKFLKIYDDYYPDQFMDSLVFLFSINVLIVENFKVKLTNV
jgi:hypothetical protein